jgi:hypothetical protein
VERKKYLLVLIEFTKMFFDENIISDNYAPLNLFTTVNNVSEL